MKNAFTNSPHLTSMVESPFLEILLEIAPASSYTADQSCVADKADIELHWRLIIVAVKVIALDVPLHAGVVTARIGPGMSRLTARARGRDNGLWRRDARLPWACGRLLDHVVEFLEVRSSELNLSREAHK